MNNDKTEISIELSRLIERQTRFFQKSDPTPSDLQEFEWAGERIRKLFAELAQRDKAA
jgi:DNA-binding transcriptional regulator PaaX